MRVVEEEAAKFERDYIKYLETTAASDITKRRLHFTDNENKPI